MSERDEQEAEPAADVGEARAAGVDVATPELGLAASAALALQGGRSAAGSRGSAGARPPDPFGGGRSLSAAQALALQRAVGNAATARMVARATLMRQPAPPAVDAPPKEGEEKEPDPSKVEWMLPRNESASLLSSRMRELRQTQERNLKKPGLTNATAFLVVTDQLVHFSADGSMVGSYALREDFDGLPPGYWAGTVRENVWRRLSRRLDPPTDWDFYPWSFKKKRTPLEQWMTDADGKRFVKNLIDHKTPALMLAVPPGGDGKGKGKGKPGPPPKWATDKAANTQKLVDKARKQISGDAPQDKTKAVTDPNLKKLPDRLVPWTDGDKTFVNVWADGAHKALELKEGETPEKLLERVQQAAEQLRDDRDPSKSVGLTNPAKEAGFDGKQKPTAAPPGKLLEPYDPDPNRPPMQNTGANLPPYPATVTMAGVDPKRPEDAVTVIGGSNQFKMTLDWTRGGRDQNLLSLVTAQMQYISYRWESIRVTPGDYAKQSAAMRHTETDDQLKEAAKVKAGEGQGTMKTLGPFGISTGEAADVSRAFANIAEDTRADLKDAEKIPWPLRRQYLEVVALSVAVRTLGTLISEFTTRLTMPLDEQKLSFKEPGDYVVRCIATPMHEEGAKYIRASSVAAFPLRVVSVRERAELGANENDREIAALEEQKKKPPAGKTAEDIQKEIDDRKLQAKSSHLANTQRRLTQFRDDLKLAQDLQADLRAGKQREQIGTDDYALRKRWLAVSLAQAQVNLDEYVAERVKWVKDLEQTEERLKGYALKGVKGASYSPRVTLASEENGQNYQLLTVLGQTKTLEDDKVVEYRLADVTSKNSQQEYIGRSTAEGAKGHQEAIRNAFVSFRENNGYGRGTIVIRLPAEMDESPLFGPLPMEREMRSAPGERERALQKLKDIATAAEVAGLIVGGPAGMMIGIVGGAAGLILSAENIRKRVAGGRFEWASFETVMDAIGILGSTVGIGAGVSGLARAAGSTARWAVTAEKLFIPIMKGQLISQVVILPANAYHQLSKLDEQIKNSKPPMTPGEIKLRRAEIVSSFMWGAFTTSVGAAQMMGMPPLFGHSEPTVKGAPPEKGGGTPPPEHGGTPPPERGGGLAPPEHGGGVPPPEHGGVTPMPDRPTPVPDEGAAGGGGRGQPPPAAPPAAPPAPSGPPPAKPEFRVIEPRELWMQVDAAVGKRTEGVPRLGRVQVVERSVLNDVHKQITGKELAGESVGMWDPKEKVAYIAADAWTPKQAELMNRSIADRMSPIAREQLGSTLAKGILEMAQRQAVRGGPEPPSSGAAAENVTQKMLEVVGQDALSKAFFESNLGAVREILGSKFGEARRNAIEQALRSGRNAEALALLDPPNSAVRDAYGPFLAEGIADLMTQQMGGVPRNAERARLMKQLAEVVGADVLKNALLNGDVGGLRTALEGAVGEHAGRVADALATGEPRAIRRALGAVKAGNPPPAVRKPPPEKPGQKTPEVQPAAPQAEHGAPKAAEPLPAPTPKEQAFADALKAGGTKESLSTAAGDFIKDAGNFKELRKLVEAGRFGTEPAQIKAAQEALQHARKQITDAVLQEVQEWLQGQERFKHLDIKMSDLGTPGFGSDRDVTVKATGKGGAQVKPNEMIAASVEGVRKAYELLNERGFPPDKALDSNFYTELHESLVKPWTSQERAAISYDQSVVSLAEMRMNSPEAFEAYVERQRQGLGTDRGDTSMASETARDARARFDEQVAAAQKLAGELRAKPAEAMLADKQKQLLEALRADPPKTPREIRQLMAEIKLLEPDAYGTRAAVEGVVDFQQALARAESLAEAGPILSGRPGRLGQRGIPIHEELATLAQAASASLGKLAHAHLAAGNGPTQAAAVSKYLSRIMQAFHEAGLSIRNPLVDRNGNIIAAKADGPASVMREIKAWAEDNSIRWKSESELMDIFIERSQKLGVDLTARIRSAELTARVQEGMVEKKVTTGDPALDKAIDQAIDNAQSPTVKGGKKPTMEGRPVTTQRRPTLDIESIARLPGENSAQDAVRRVERLIGETISDTPFRAAWEEARAAVLDGKTVESFGREGVIGKKGLYERCREAFWRRVYSDKTPRVDVVDPVDGVTKKVTMREYLDKYLGFDVYPGGVTPELRVTRGDLSPQQRSVSLDHVQEKAIGDNWKKAIDADNLVFEFADPNSFRESMQKRHKMR